MSGVAPARLLRAVEAVAPRASEHVLEIGCGNGVAAALVLARLGAAGRYVGVDRSAVATTAARVRNRAAVTSGAARFETRALATVDVDALGSFHAVFAVNVNAFWTGDAAAELAVVRAVLRPRGRFVLVYESPSLAKLEAPLTAALLAGGFAPVAAVKRGVLVVRSSSVRRRPR